MEVIRCATYSQGYLNRQVIMLMSCQGVPDDVFMKKQKQATKRLNTKYMVDKMYKKVEELSKNSVEEEKSEKFCQKSKFSLVLLVSLPTSSKPHCSLVSNNTKRPKYPVIYCRLTLSCRRSRCLNKFWLTWFSGNLYR